MIYLGIDGGGTKTEYLLFDSEKGILSCRKGGTIDLHLIGEEGFRRELRENSLALLSSASLKEEELSGIAAGVPCYGENAAEQQLVDTAVKELFSLPCRVENDVYFSSYGALAGESGICMLAGTGSMAMGLGSDGSFVRSGGWSRYYSDEGSAFWLGTEAMRLFVSQADEISQRGPLYDIVMEEYSLSEPMDFIKTGDTLYEGRTGAAAFQLLLRRAAQAGDNSALELYERAAGEMARQILSVKRKLERKGQSCRRVVCAGGLLENTEFLRNSLAALLEREGLSVEQAVLSAAKGAVLCLALNDGADRAGCVSLLQKSRVYIAQ